MDVELEGKQISFGKVLLRRELRRNLKIRNNSAIPIFWRITSADPIDSQLKISSTDGKMKARADSNVVFSYSASRVSCIDQFRIE